MSDVNVVIELLHAHSKMPVKAHENDACFDLEYIDAKADGELVLSPLARSLIPCGFKMMIPPGWEAQIRSRSGLPLKNGVIVANGIGTIDSGYVGEIGVVLMNLGSSPLRLRNGDRIAQMCIKPVPKVSFEIGKVSELVTERGSNGFGSTGLSS